MARRSRSQRLMQLLPFLIFVAGLSMLIWTDPITRCFIHIRRPGTLQATALLLTNQYSPDVRFAGFVAIGAALAWWLLAARFRRKR